MLLKDVSAIKVACGNNLQETHQTGIRVGHITCIVTSELCLDFLCVFQLGKVIDAYMKFKPMVIKVQECQNCSLRS